MTENHNRTSPEGRPGRPWYVPDVVSSAGVVLVYAAFLGVLHFIAYHLGLVVDRKEIQTATSRFPRYSEYGLPLEPGAYVWCGRGGFWRLVR